MDLTPLSRTTTTAIRNAVQPGWRNQAIAQACAFSSPFFVSMSVIEMLRQSRLFRANHRRVVALLVLLFTRKSVMLEKELSFAGRVVHDCFDDLVSYKYVVVSIYITVCQLLL